MNIRLMKYLEDNQLALTLVPKTGFGQRYLPRMLSMKCHVMSLVITNLIITNFGICAKALDSLDSSAIGVGSRNKWVAEGCNLVMFRVT